MTYIGHSKEELTREYNTINQREHSNNRLSIWTITIIQQQYGLTIYTTCNAIEIHTEKSQTML